MVRFAPAAAPDSLVPSAAGTRRVELCQPGFASSSSSLWPQPPPGKRGRGCGKGWGGGVRGAGGVCQNWGEHLLCRVSKTNQHLSIAVLIPYPEAGGRPRRELNIVTRAACSTPILFGGPGETKSNNTIVEITVKKKKKKQKKTQQKNSVSFSTVILVIICLNLFFFFPVL